jgi:hypothetical protein
MDATSKTTHPLLELAAISQQLANPPRGERTRDAFVRVAGELRPVLG